MAGRSDALADHVAIVTGASSGIGLSVAEAMAGAGAAVTVNYRSDADAANDLVRRIQGRGGRAIAVEADVASEEAVTQLFDKTIDLFGRIDVLIANSGVQKDAAVADMTLDDWNTVLGVNLTGQFLCAREAIRRFRTQPHDGRPARSAGSIVTMSPVH